jgi:hypothetical protein
MTLSKILCFLFLNALPRRETIQVSLVKNKRERKKWGREVPFLVIEQSHRILIFLTNST